MFRTVCILLIGDDRARLEAVAGDRYRQPKQSCQAQIILLSAERLSVRKLAHCAVARGHTAIVRVIFHLTGVCVSSIPRIWKVMGFSFIACAVSNARPTPNWPASSKTSRASTWTRWPMPSCYQRKVPNPGLASHPVGLHVNLGKCRTMTYDYKRQSTITLFTALNVLERAVTGRCMRRHRHH